MHSGECVIPLSIQEKLRLLEVEKEQLQSRLSQLETEIQEQHRLLVEQPVHRAEFIACLPPEILLHIFLLHIQLDDDDPEVMLELDLRPVTMSHVCQRWRYIALAASDLWTNLVFNKPSAVQIFASRSKERPVNVIHVPRPGPCSSSPGELYRPLATTRKRWRNVLWEAPLERTRSLLLILNYDRTTFSHLHTLDIRVQARESPCKPVLLQTFGSVRFPKLSRLLLSGISPSELPPTTAQCIRLLHVHFPISRPYPNNPLLPPYFRMSSFCAYLMQASQLETLVMEDCTPLMDVYLHPISGHYASIKSSSVNAIRATPPTSAVSLPNLCRLDWTSAPPKDLWRLFHFLHMPALRQLDLSLGKADDRWFAVQERVISPMSSSHPLSLHPVNLVPQFEALRELRVVCCDVDGLTLALRKLHLPSLERLDLSYTRASESRSLSTRKTTTNSHVKLPPLESIFREPRLVKLAALTLSGFLLDMSTTVTMLAYMPALKYLYLDCCKGIDECSATPKSTRDSDLDSDTNNNPTKRWTCAHLELMVIGHCPNLKFGWLKRLVAARRQASEDRHSYSARLIRPLPSLRKNVHGNGLGTGSASPRPATPRKPPMVQRVADSPLYPSLSSPNGSFVAGWNPHKPIQLTTTMTLRVEDCRRISEVEVMSLGCKRYGNVNVAWKA